MSLISKARAAWIAEHVLPFEGLMRGWLAKRNRGNLEVDDIIQETYAILAELDSVGDIRSPKNYAFQVANSVIQSHLRRAQIVSIQSLTDIEPYRLPQDGVTPEREASDRHDLKITIEFISALPARCRKVLVLKRLHGLSYKEIADDLKISEVAVEKLLAKGTRLLMDAFGRGGNRLRQSSQGGPAKVGRK